MCFSAEASLLASAVLAPAGGYSMAVALRTSPRLLPTAMIPALFGLQQFCEGLVWIGFHQADEVLVRRASLAFLFFAVAVWPFWLAFAGAMRERHPVRRGLLGLLSLLGSAWLLGVYLPILLAPATAWSTQIVEHSIYYDYYHLGVFQYVSPWLVRLAYLSFIVLPLCLQAGHLNWRGGLVVAASAAMAALIYHYAFISVWCFFAAILSGFVAWEFYRLEHRASLPSYFLDLAGAEGAQVHTGEAA